VSANARYSCLYTGWVRHRRFLPVKHQFIYPIFMVYLDLDEMPELLNRRWFCTTDFFNIVAFWRKDYFQSSPRCLARSKPYEGELKQDVIDFVTDDAQQQELSVPEISRVRMLTHLRYFNLIINPVTFYYCFDSDDGLQAIVAEITNTPWGERHSYVLHVGGDSDVMKHKHKGRNKHRFKFDKRFHVSPFNPMAMRYRWNFSEPDHALFVHMDNLMRSAEQHKYAEGRGMPDEGLSHSDEGGHKEKHFDATLSLKRQSFNRLGRALIRYPFMTVSVAVGIYWQAFKLWLKKAPFYDHPKHARDKNEQPQT